MPVIVPVANAANGEMCVPTGQLGVGVDLAIHVARERTPITDEYRIISDPSMDHRDSDVPSDNGSHFLGDVE